MNWSQYLDDSYRTLIDLGQADNLIHGAIGVSTEIGELKEAFDQVNQKEELGDIFWYMAIFWREINLEWDSMWIESESSDIDFLSYAECLNSLDFLSKQLLDQAKRVKFYSMPLEKFKTNILYEISIRLTHLMKRAEFDFEAIMETNISKLRQRFPDKFTSDSALNRDLSKERQILEK